jgi:fructuronate reductase
LQNIGIKIRKSGNQEIGKGEREQMKLSEQGLKNKEQWEQAGYQLPQFDREAVTAATKENPFWIHFGAGNIFRAFQANVVQKLLDAGELDRGLIVAEGFDYEIVQKMNRPHDEYSILVTLKADGNVEKTVVGSVVESCILDSADASEYERLKEIFRRESLQMVSFTITEKGYSLADSKGAFLPAVQADFAAGPEKPVSYIGKVTSLLYARYQAGTKPVAMVSMDNCSHNGDKLFAAVSTFAEKWTENGTANKEFLSYIKDKEKVSFPWSMIDKITPRPDASVEAILKADGVEGLEPVITSKNTYVAPFVNAEECEYLVIEDAFPNGRPALEKGGLIFTERETVDKVEKMKVCTCLNPLHTALAVFGCLLGYHKISDEMKDSELKKLVETIGYQEGLPVVVNPGILDPKEFIGTVLRVRVPNPFMPDTPQRIATDTSQKLAIRFGETIKAYQASKELDVADLKLIPLVFAGWLRYLMAVDDEGNAFSLSPDPLLDSVCPHVAGFSLGRAAGAEQALKPVLENEKIFGVNLYEAGLAQKVCGYFEELAAGRGAVRAVLKKYLD